MSRKKNSDDQNKNSRQEAIKSLIALQQIDSQKKLAEALLLEGFEVTQSTLSRDMRELGLIKKQSQNGGYVYRMPENGEISSQSRVAGLLVHSVSDITAAMNQIVIHTDAGMAQAVCASIDCLHFEEIIGTLAGEDTILIITGSPELARQLKNKLDAFRQAL